MAEKENFWTVYDGPAGRQLMRARTEALAAAWLDTHTMPSQYEPKRLDGTGWLPDFWVPSSRVLIDVKGGDVGDITVEEREVLWESAQILRERGIAVIVWNGGDRAWDVVLVDKPSFKLAPVHAHRCVECGNWTMFWSECKTCEKERPFDLQHLGRNYVVDPAKSFREFDCRPALEYHGVGVKKGASITTKFIVDIPSDVAPAGLPGERSFHSIEEVSQSEFNAFEQKLRTDAERREREGKPVDERFENRQDKKRAKFQSSVYYLKVEGPRRCLP